MKVVEAMLVGTARDTSRSPLYQTMLAWEQAGGWGDDDSGLFQMETMSENWGTTSADSDEAAAGVKFEVELYLPPVGDQLQGGVGYSLQLFEESTVGTEAGDTCTSNTVAATTTTQCIAMYGHTGGRASGGAME